MLDIRRRNNVVTRGTGDKAIVFANGFGCDQRLWRFVAPEFEKRHRIVLFDYVGTGQSERNAYDGSRYQTLDGYVRDLLEVCESLALNDALLVGHSVGCMIGLLAALNAPRLFSKLALIGPSPRYIDDPPEYIGGFAREDVEGLLALMDHNFIGWAGELAKLVLHEPELAAELRKTFCSNEPVAMRAFATATFLSDHRTVLPKVDVPCLVLQCARDEIAPPAVGKYVRRQLRRATLRMLDVPGHMPQMSHPELVIAALREFFEPHR